MAIFDEQQLNRMRQEAIRRSQEMHSRAAPASPAGDLPQSPAGIPRAEDGGSSSRPKQDILSGILGDIFGGGLDSDKLLIAALLILMIKEGADIKLILALGYILI